jgi:hypothetical protein
MITRAFFELSHGETRPHFPAQTLRQLARSKPRLIQILAFRKTPL